MRARLLLVACLACAAPAQAEVLAARTVYARAVLTAEDVTGGPDAGALIGREARITIRAGQALRPEDFVAPALVERNQAIVLSYDHGDLRISAAGRALGRAALGETVRAMNLQSKTIVAGRVIAAGTVAVNSD